MSRARRRRACGLGALAFAVAAGVGSPPSRGADGLADVRITDSVPVLNVLGEPYQHVLTVVNAGPDASGDVTVVESVTTRSEFMSATASVGACVYVSATRIVFCDLGSLAPGTTVRIAITLRAVELGGYFVTAAVAGTTPDPDWSNNYASSSTGIERQPVNLALSARGPRTSRRNLFVVDHFAVRNPSRFAAAVVFRARSSRRLRIVSALERGRACPLGSGRVACQLGTLAPRSQVSMTIVAAPARLGSAAVFGSVALVGTETVDPNPTNNVARARTEVTRR